MQSLPFVYFEVPNLSILTGLWAGTQDGAFLCLPLITAVIEQINLDQS